MARLTAELVATLVDRVSGPAAKVAAALRAAERQTKAITRATQAGIGSRFAADLQRIGASGSQIDRVTRAWERYRRSAGLAADASKWTKAQVNQVKAWERANILALKNVTAAQPRSASAVGARAAGGGDGLTAGHGALLGAAASRLGLSSAAAPIAVAAGGAYALNRATKQALSFEQVMYEVEKATDSSGAAAQRYADAVLKMATETGKTSTELGGILASAGFAGRPKDELLDFTRYAAKATGAWGTSAEATGQALAEIGNIYQANQKRIEEIGDAINSVADSSASKETDLLDFLRRSGAQAKILGITAEQTLAYGAALKEVGVQSEVAATGFNALLTKLATGAEDDDWNKELKKLGINTKAFTATLKKDAPAAISILLASINKISDGTKKMAVLKDLFGAEYADDIARLAGNLGGVEKMLGLVGRKANYLGSVSKSFELLKEKDFNRVARFNAQMERLSITVGGPLKSVVGEVADKLSEAAEAFHRIRSGESPTFNAINDRARDVVDHHLAAQEVNRPDVRPDYDPETRRRVDARRALLERQAYDDRVSKLDAEIADKQKRLDAMPGGVWSPFKPHAQRELDTVKSKRDGLVGAQRAVDELQVRLAENEAAQRGQKTRMGPGMQGDKPQPITPGLIQLGRGPYGTYSPPKPAPLPPPRPADLPGAVPALKSFDEIYTPKVDTSQLEAARDKVTEAKAGFDALNTTANPTVNMASVIELEQRLLRIDGLMTRIGAKAGGIKSAVASAGAEALPRGRSEVAKATADLSRSRETNQQDRPLYG